MNTPLDITTRVKIDGKPRQITVNGVLTERTAYASYGHDAQGGEMATRRGTVGILLDINQDPSCSDAHDKRSIQMPRAPQFGDTEYCRCSGTRWVTQQGIGRAGV